MSHRGILPITPVHLCRAFVADFIPTILNIESIKTANLQSAVYQLWLKCTESSSVLKWNLKQFVQMDTWGEKVQCQDDVKLHFHFKPLCCPRRGCPPAWCFAVRPLWQLKPFFSWDKRWETRPTDYQPVSAELTEPRSSGSYFYLCFLPRLILISQCSPTPPPPSPPLPREAGVQWPRSVHARPSWHASPSPLRSPSTRKLHRISNKYRYIVHRKWLLSWAPH